MMGTDLSEVEQIENRIDAEAWDRQIEADSDAGRLDALMEKSLAEHKAGEKPCPLTLLAAQAN